MKHSSPAVLLDSRNSIASGSVVDVWVAFDRFWPLKSTSALRPLNPLPSPPPSVGLSGLKLLFDAHACNKVPFTEKYSLEV